VSKIENNKYMKRNIKMKNTTIGNSSDDSEDNCGGDVAAGSSTYNAVSSSTTPGVSNSQISVAGGSAGLRNTFGRDETDDDDGSLHQCDTCRATFKSKTICDKHRLFCATLAGMRSGRTNKKYTIMSLDDDALLPSPKEMFMLIQELTLKYNKVKEELDVMKTWAKMVGRRLGGGGSGDGSGGGIGAAGAAGAAGAGALGNSDYLTPFTSISRQKRQNMEMILNDDDAAMSAAAASTGQQCPIQQRPTFMQWYSSFALEQEHLDYVFQSDLVSGIVNVILKLVSAYTNETGKSHLIPFKFTDVKQGSFYIYDAPFSLDAPVLPPPGSGGGDERKWRFIEPCEFQLMVNSVHKLLLKEFKKWQDRNWEQQNKINQNKQKATLSYRSVMSSFQCSPAMATCDGEYLPLSASGGEIDGGGGGGGGGGYYDDEPNTPPSYLKDAVLTDDFASLYNKYADKVMGGTLSPDSIITRVRAKLWKDMKAWML
jgi:hypothetical protein